MSAEAARRAVLEYLGSNGENISDAACVFGINRPVVYDILRKEAEGDLGDRSKAPRHCPSRTPSEVEAQVVKAKNKTRLGPKRLSAHLLKNEGLSIPAATIRHILRRNKRLRTRNNGR